MNLYLLDNPRMPDMKGVYRFSSASLLLQKKLRQNRSTPPQNPKECMAASIQASETGLQQVDAARRKKGWTKRASAWCDAAGKISASTLDRFWAKKPISQEYFVAICQAVGIDDWEAIADFPLDSSSSGSPDPPLTAHSRFSFFSYDPKTWTGRDRELADLTAALEQGQRLLLIHGMTGIGKTALAERLAAESLGTVGANGHSPVQYVAVVFDRGVGSVEFTRGAIAILDAMDDPTAQQLPDDQILPYLLKQLRETPVWLQLDSLEYLLQHNAAGEWEFVDPAWVEFFDQVLAATSANTGRITGYPASNTPPPPSARKKRLDAMLSKPLPNCPTCRANC